MGYVKAIHIMEIEILVKKQSVNTYFFYIYLKNVSASGFTLTLMSYKAIQ